MKPNKNLFYVYSAIALIIAFLGGAAIDKYFFNGNTNSSGLNGGSAFLGLSSSKNINGQNAEHNSKLFYRTVKYLQYLRYLPLSHKGPGDYSFSFPVPQELKDTADSYRWNSQNPFILGAAANYLAVTGKLKEGDFAAPQINGNLLKSLKDSFNKKEFDPQPWRWVFIHQAKKGETVNLFENGRLYFSTPANTGEFGMTPQGTWFVNLRYPDTSMKGLSPSHISEKKYESIVIKNPNEVGCLHGHPVKWIKYNDSGIKYVSYFDHGIALHYIKRSKYGFPQSVGCVELPMEGAEFIYKNIDYGTVVTVIGIAGKREKKKNNHPLICTQPKQATIATSFKNHESSDINKLKNTGYNSKIKNSYKNHNKNKVRAETLTLSFHRKSETLNNKSLNSSGSVQDTKSSNKNNLKIPAR